METADTLMKIKGAEKLQSDSGKRIWSRKQRWMKKTADDFKYA